jgi:hypothetical protein
LTHEIRRNHFHRRQGLPAAFSREVMIADNLIFKVANSIFIKRNKGLVQAYQQRHGRLPDIANPQRYTERMLWRKIVDHSPKFVLFSDKLATKEYVQRLCPDLAVPRTLWVGCDADAIPDDLLRGDVYVKASHGCDFNQRIRGGQCDRPALKKQTDLWLASTYGSDSGQWAYSQVDPKLFVEEAVGDVEAGMVEFNVRACDGRAIMGSVIGFCKTPSQWTIYLDPEGKPTPGMNDPDGSPITLLPEGMEIMEPYRRAVSLTEQLTVGVDYVRCDFLWNGAELFGGEITVYPAAGLPEIINSSARAITLSGWDLVQSHFLKSSQTGWKRIYADALKRQLNSVKIDDSKVLK